MIALLRALRAGGAAPGWRFERRVNDPGNWRELWYRGEQLVYSEECSDERGRVATDYLTHERWSDEAEAGVRGGWRHHYTETPFWVNEN